MQFYTRFTGYRQKPKSITAHLLDPNRGYSTQQWEVGKDVEESTASTFAKDGNLYIAVAYEKGEPHLTVCDRDTWNQAKQAFDSTESRLEDSPSLKMLREFERMQNSR
jgi:hypothetical protein